MMTIEEKRGIARRAFMRGMGVTMGLPLVDAITPGTHLAASAQEASIVKRIPESVMVQQRIPDSIIEGFRKLQDDLASICDVLVGLGLNNCVYSGVKPLDPKSRICGPARTLRLIPLQDPRSQAGTIWEEQHPGSLINESTPGDVIVIDQGRQVNKCIWGVHLGRTHGHSLEVVPHRRCRNRWGVSRYDGGGRDRGAALRKGSLRRNTRTVSGRR